MPTGVDEHDELIRHNSVDFMLSMTSTWPGGMFSAASDCRLSGLGHVDPLIANHAASGLGATRGSWRGESRSQSCTAGRTPL